MKGFTHTLQYHVILVVTEMPASCMQFPGSRAKQITRRLRSKRSDWKRKAGNEYLS
jgi:hypothetical protein